MLAHRSQGKKRSSRHNELPTVPIRGWRPQLPPLPDQQVPPVGPVPELHILTLDPEPQYVVHAPLLQNVLSQAPLQQATPWQAPLQQATPLPVPLEQLQARLPVLQVFEAPDPPVQLAP